jgi:hypothetical protein
LAQYATTQHAQEVLAALKTDSAFLKSNKRHAKLKAVLFMDQV